MDTFYSLRTGTHTVFILYRIRVIRVPACARVSRVSRVSRLPPVSFYR